MVEKELNGSDHGYNYKEREDIRAEGGEEA
jgi:hypothetical protein